MFAILYALGTFLADLFKSRRRLEAENLLLRLQLSVALRRAPPRPRFRSIDRALLVWMIRLWPSLLGAVQIVQPETVLRWHRAGFRALGVGNHEQGRGAQRSIALRELIQRMSMENPLWGASRIHGELATRPLLTQHDRAAHIVAYDMEPVLANIDADYDDFSVEFLRHGVLLVFGAPRQLRLLVGQEHGRTIPLADIGAACQAPGD